MERCSSRTVVLQSYVVPSSLSTFSSAYTILWPHMYVVLQAEHPPHLRHARVGAWRLISEEEWTSSPSLPVWKRTHPGWFRYPEFLFPVSGGALETSEGRHLWLVSVVHSLDFCKQSVVQGLIRRLTCNWVTMTTRDFNIKYSLPAWHFGCLGNKTWCNGYLSQLESKSITGSVIINKSRDKVLFIIYS